MTFVKTLPLAVWLALLPAIAHAQSTPPTPPPQVANQAVFCEGSYALCIKAPCTPIPTIDRLGNYTYDRVSCTCEIENGWSMGPGQCTDRIPVKQGKLIYMISTYSNYFNNQNSTLSCSSSSTVWAWCYGAPCVVAEADVAKGKTTCTCPVVTGPMKTLGGINCSTDSCNSIWSAAKPKADEFASRHFYHHIHTHYPNYPVNGQAPMCTASSK